MGGKGKKGVAATPTHGLNCSVQRCCLERDSEDGSGAFVRLKLRCSLLPLLFRTTGGREGDGGGGRGVGVQLLQPPSALCEGHYRHRGWRQVGA